MLLGCLGLDLDWGRVTGEGMEGETEIKGMMGWGGWDCRFW